MTIIQFRGTSYKILIEELNYPFLSSDGTDDMLCDNVSVYNFDVNSTDIVFVSNYTRKGVMTYSDIKIELEYIQDKSIRWVSEERRNILITYYTKILSLFKSHIRDEKIEKLINPIDHNNLVLAC